MSRTALLLIAFVVGLCPHPARAQGRTLCEALELLDGFDMADGPTGVFFDSLPRCSSSEARRLYYHGSAPIEGTLSDLKVLPFVTQGAYLCGIADAHDTRSRATFGALGTFGVESHFRVTRRDPSQGRLEAQRLGKIFLFGVSATLERQDMAWTVPGELQSGQFGGYVELRVDQGSWDWNPAAISFPLATPAGAVVVTLDLELHGRTPRDSMENNLIAAAIARPFRFDQWTSCLADEPGCGPDGLCLEVCGPSRPVPYIKYAFDHALNACPGACGSLTDGMLPYFGAFGGASGSNGAYIYMSPFRSWIHLGRTGDSTDRVPPAESFEAPPEEPVASLNLDRFSSLGSHATTWGRLDLEVTYEAAIASITLGTTTTLAVRDGFAVRQRDTPLGFDFGSTSGLKEIHLQTAIDSQAAIDIDARITVDVDLPAFDPPEVTFHLPNLVQRTLTPGETTATKLSYFIDAPEPHSELHRYEIRGLPESDPEQARLDCQFDEAAPTRRPPTSVSNPGVFLKNVAERAIHAIHPCHVHYCAGGDSTTATGARRPNRSSARA